MNVANKAIAFSHRVSIVSAITLQLVSAITFSLSTKSSIPHTIVPVTNCAVAGLESPGARLVIVRHKADVEIVRSRVEFRKGSDAAAVDS